MKILYIGESWLGSCARSLRDALARRDDVHLDEINEDVWHTPARALWVRALNRITAAAHRREFNEQVMSRVRELRPDVVMTYKGSLVRAELLNAIRQLGVLTVNVYPDNSPHAHGAAHREAVGTYDLVVSTKAYHPALWNDLYGYRNRCLFVAQGYDPVLHLVTEAPEQFDFDVVMVATYRPEYGRLMAGFAKALADTKIKVSIGGHGWEAARARLPSHWVFPGGIIGRSYVSLLRKGKICIAPLTRDVRINGQAHPGDVDTTRSYELAAAHCFFVHRRTDFALQLYGADEVPMFDDGAELAQQVRYYLAHDQERAGMAAAAHRRAVPAYSLDARAAQIVEILKDAIASNQGALSA